MPFKSGDDPNRGRGPKPGTGGRPSTSVRIRAGVLLEEHQVLEALAKQAAKGKTPQAKLLLQLSGDLKEHVDVDHRYPDLEEATDQELQARLDALRTKAARVLEFRRRTGTGSA